jgi:uncharacterized membrane protein YjjP (DUF1212 family)
METEESIIAYELCNLINLGASGIFGAFLALYFSGIFDDSEMILITFLCLTLVFVLNSIIKIKLFRKENGS